MKLFTHEPPDDKLSDSELELKNEALAVLVGEGIDEPDARERVNKNWQAAGNTLGKLIRI